MKSTRWVLIAGMMLSTTLFAQGLRQQGQDTQQNWLKFEKELGLQTRYAVDMEIEAMGEDAMAVHGNGHATAAETGCGIREC